MQVVQKAHIYDQNLLEQILGEAFTGETHREVISMSWKARCSPRKKKYVKAVQSDRIGFFSLLEKLLK